MKRILLPGGLMFLALLGILLWSQAAFACVSNQVEDGESQNPSILVINRCAQPIAWALCVNVSSRAFRDTPTGFTAPGGVSRYRLWLREGDSFRYNLNYAPANRGASPPSC